MEIPSMKDLDEAIAEYNTSFIEFKYDLPEYWTKRDRYGLPLNTANLPFLSHMANFIMVEVNAPSFPWGKHSLSLSTLLVCSLASTIYSV